MNRDQVYARIRSLIGNPSVDEIPDRVLAPQVDQALEDLASELGFLLKTDTMDLTQAQYEYILPEDFIEGHRLEWNNNALSPATTYQWDRDGVKWTDTTVNGSPNMWAVRSRSLYITPSPSAAALTTDPELSLTYVAASPGLAANGVRGFTQGDYWLLAARAAINWMGVRPTADNSNEKRLLFLQKEYERRLKLAENIRQDAIASKAQSVAFVRRRLPAAR